MKAPECKVHRYIGLIQLQFEQWIIFTLIKLLELVCSGPLGLNRMEFIPYKPMPFQWSCHQSTVKVVREFETHIA